jgi:DnaK suppressor protein
MPGKKAATKKKKKTGSTTKTTGKTSRKASTSRKAGASRKKVGRSSKSARKTTSTSGKKGTSKKTSKKKAAPDKQKAAVRKSTSKKTRPASKRKVVAKPASSKKKTSSSTVTRRPTKPQDAAGSVEVKPTKVVATNDHLKTASSVLFGPVRGFKPYEPKRGEPYMSEEQLEHFRNILLAWKRELMEEVDRTVLHMKDDAANFPDPNDRATQESEFGLELRTRDRERKLLKKIDSALQRIEDGSYGYCEETGDEIGLRRLEARPVATLCVEAQERRELAERQFRDREDYYR